jgi:peptide/nickel transport system substrate-binding protein
VTFRSLLRVLLTVLVSGCAAPPVPDVVTLAIENPPLNLDPRIGLDASSERIASLIFSSLVRRDESSAIVPDLAESWDIPDPTTYIFHLRRGVRFHDGRLLTARDVIYTFRSILDRSVETPKLGTYLLVDEIEAVDDLTVRFSLKEPFAPFLWNLTSGAIGIVPEGAGSELAQHPIGSGPFVFGHYRRDEEVFLRSNPDYDGVQPRIEAVRFKIVPEAIVRALELRKGTVDIALNVLPPDMVEALGDETELAVINEEGTNYQYLAFNLEDPVFAESLDHVGRQHV